MHAYSFKHIKTFKINLVTMHSTTQLQKLKCKISISQQTCTMYIISKTFKTFYF